MKKRLLTALILGSLAAVGAAWADAPGKGAAVLMPASTVKWVDVPNAPGVKMSVVEGDGTKGPHHFFLKFPAGFKVGAHHHTPDHFGAIVSGTLVLTIDGKDHVLAPGSYVGLTQKTKHATRCEKGSDCIMFISARGAWDAIMADAPAASAAKK
jgi:quercetin dioxygenase-like cupin family protein